MFLVLRYSGSSAVMSRIEELVGGKGKVAKLFLIAKAPHHTVSTKRGRLQNNDEDLAFCS